MGTGANGVKVPVCAREVKPVIKFLSSFYIIGQDSGGKWRCSCPAFGKASQVRAALASHSRAPP